MRREVQVAIDWTDPGPLARFWADVLGHQWEDPPSGYPSWSDFSQAVGAPGEWSALVDAEVRRLVVGGARHLRTIEDEMDYFAVMQDPEGNEFCIC